MMKVFSYGGGVQSTAALVLSALGRLDYPTFFFCNVGNDSEHPDTLKYVREIAMPYAKAHGIELVELQKKLKDGTPDTIYSHLTRPNSRSIGIPVRMNGSGAPGRRSCTFDYKIAVVDKEVKGRTPKGVIPGLKKSLLHYCGIEEINKETMKKVLAVIDALFMEHEPVVQVGLGISLDEAQRVKPNMDPDTIYWKVNTHPLIFEVERPLTRQDCINIITAASLPIPPKSACWFCPYHRLSKWQDMRLHEPELFRKSANLEAFINQRRKDLGMDEVWFSRLLMPLEQATTAYQQHSLFDTEDDECEGYCFV